MLSNNPIRVFILELANLYCSVSEHEGSSNRGEVVLASIQTGLRVDSCGTYIQNPSVTR